MKQDTDKDIFDITSYDYELPPELIAQNPHSPADQCKLMLVDRQTGAIKDKIFSDVTDYLSSDYILIFNNSKVVRARILLQNARIVRENQVIHGMEGELFYLSPLGNGHYHFLVKPGSKLKVGTVVMLWDHKLSIVADHDYGRVIEYQGDIFALLDQYGQMPLPPYIGFDQSKESLYQPVVASNPWSVASPTASLHFTPKLLENIKHQGVQFDYTTLHIGLGTFKSIDTNNIKDYNIHHEACEVDLDIFTRIMNYKQNKKTILAVWTTACRTLESLPYCFLLTQDNLKDLLPSKVVSFRKELTSSISIDEAKKMIASYDIDSDSSKIYFSCSLYITPWYTFRVINQLITNFHLPKSSLMVLVASLMWYDLMMRCYEHAIAHHYQFYSFGDAMRIR